MILLRDQVAAEAVVDDGGAEAKCALLAEDLA
jgi:hypothetical protein